MAKTMNWFYYDKSSNRKGPITQSALQEMAKQGIITPMSRMETDTGKSGVAGQISCLFPPPLPPPPPPPVPRPSFIETMASSMRATMSFIAATLGFVLVLVLVVFVVWLLYSLLVVTETLPPPPAGGVLERILMFGNPHGEKTKGNDNAEQNDNGAVEEESNNSPDVFSEPPGPDNEELSINQVPSPNEDAERRIAAERRQADIKSRNELIASAVHIDTAISAAGFSGNRAVSMSNLANFGTSALQVDFNRTYDVWNRASPFDKERTKVEFERVRTFIENHVRTQITSKTYFGDWSYQASNVTVTGNESSFTMTIDVGFSALRFRSLEIEETVLRFPQGVTAAFSGFGSSRITLHVYGDTSVIREIYENRDSYRVHVCFTNFLSSGVPTFRNSSEPISAEVLSVALVRR